MRKTNIMYCNISYKEGNIVNSYSKLEKDGTFLVKLYGLFG